MNSRPLQDAARGTSRVSCVQRFKTLFLGHALNPNDQGIFHKISLIAFFAWVGLGADGLSSSCYGPAEAFLALGKHTHLALFVALATGLTVMVISASYSQIIELFPTGGGGYVVASKLLSPTVGMVSGCALLIDYVLTITLSIASGADAIFSFLPADWYGLRLDFAVCGVVALTVVNLRGVKESVLALVPIFSLFVLTHAALIAIGILAHLSDFSTLAVQTSLEIRQTSAQVGAGGVLFLILRAYSMGAGTFTGIEAVSNGLPILREPKVKTGKRTMTYMAVSLASTVVGLILVFLLYRVEAQEGKTLNAVLVEQTVAAWPAGVGYPFLLLTLVSEAALLFVAAQAGFLDGPRVLANMAQDRWFPTKFAMLSDRLVTQNGILLMGGSALALMLITRGSVGVLLVLYSINVFITFVVSQLGMVRHWWKNRAAVDHWRKRLAVNGIGLALTSFILVSITVSKFEEGGWATLLVTGALVGLAVVIRRHYRRTGKLLSRLNSLLDLSLEAGRDPITAAAFPIAGADAKTAVVLVNGFNGLGLHTLFNIHKVFPREFQNFVFVQIGMVDAGVFKGAEQIERLKERTARDLGRYVSYMHRQGFAAESFSAIGIDIVHEITNLTPRILERFPRSVFFGGQIVFPQDSFWTRLLHNYVVFAVQRQLYRKAVPFVIIPVRV